MSAPTYDVHRASKLNTKLHLAGVSLFEMHAKHIVSAAVSEPRLTFSLRQQEVVYAALGDDVLPVYVVAVQLQRLDDNDNPVPLGEIMVAMRAAYAKHENWTDEDSLYLDDFVGIVGWMHVWPYIRAEVQTLSSKLGFPALTLPTLLAGQTANIRVRRLHPAPTKPDASPRKKLAKARSKKPAKTR